MSRFYALAFAAAITFVLDYFMLPYVAQPWTLFACSIAAMVIAFVAAYLAERTRW